MDSQQSDPREPSDLHSTSRESHTLQSIHYRGICVRSEDGRPIRGAVVRFFLHRQSTPHLTLWKMMTTDADGRFTIEGQIEHEDDIDLKRSRIAITASERASRVFYWQDSPGIARLEMAPAASITGRVTDSKSQPVAGAIVRVGPNPLPGVNEAMTDAVGRFDIADLEAAEELSFGMRNVLVVAHPEHNPQTATFTSVPSSIDIVLKSNSSDLPQSVTPKTQPAEPRPKTATAMPKRVRHFTGLTTGNDVKIACSADGRLVAAANGNPTRVMQRGGTSRVKGNWKPSVDILDAETGKPVVSLKLATADENALLAATERISHFEATALAFSPDGNVLAVGTSIGQVKLFNTRTGELDRSLDDEPAKLADKRAPQKWNLLRRAMGSVASLAFSPDGSLLATCGESFGDFAAIFDGVRRLGSRNTGPGRVKLWEVQSGTPKRDLVGHSHAHAVAFSPDGNLLASGGRWLDHSESGTGVIIWNPRTGEKIRRAKIVANGGTRSVAFSPDGKLVAIGSQHFDKANDTSTGAISVAYALSGITKWKQTVPGWANPLAFSPDGESVAVLCGGRSMRFLETETGEVKHEIRPADSSQGGEWTDFAIASQRRKMAIGGVDNARRGSVELWGWEEESVILTFEVDEKSASRDKPVDMDDLLSTIERRLERGWVGRTRVRKIGPQRIEVIAFTTDPEHVRRIERLVTSPGTIEFRILANDRDHKELIERARKDGGPRVLDADGTLAAWWVPVATGHEANRQVYPGIAIRTVQGDRGETSEVLVVPDPFDVTDAYLVEATSGEDGSGKPIVRFTFDKRGGMLLGGLTGANLPDKSDGFSRRVGIILNGKLHSAPAIRSIIRERGEITGDFDRDEVEDLVNVFNAGALPVPLEKVSEVRMIR